MLKRKALEHAEDEKAQRRVRSKQYTDREKYCGTGPLNGTEYNRGRNSRWPSMPQIGPPANEQNATHARQIQSSSQSTKLLDTLNDVLRASSGGGNQSNTDSDKDILYQCTNLRDSLESQITSKPPPSNLIGKARTHSTSQDARSDEYSIKIPSTSSLPPWTLSSIPSSLPPLPSINSAALETAAFTHSGMTTNQSTLSYERLEWVGDAYIYLISTLLISSTFTTHLPGKCAQIRELLVKNETLASYARQYGFEKRARLPTEFSNDPNVVYRAKAAEKTKVLGDIFEAYVAAIIMSDPDHGIDRVATWLRSLWARTIAKHISDQVRQDEKSRSRSANDPTANLNPKEVLARKITSRGVKIHYRDAGPETKDPVTGLLVFKVAVYLDGWGEKDKSLGVGSGASKKDAGMKAAEMALGNRKLVAGYEEMKRMFDEKVRVEREQAALETEG